jgi:hypothetical protein
MEIGRPMKVRQNTLPRLINYFLKLLIVFEKCVLAMLKI